MVTYSKLLYEKSFSDKVSKKAYLKACKWLAQNVYSKVGLTKYITVQIVKEFENKKKKTLPTFNVKLFMTINEDEERKSFCQKCQQMHTIFYSIDKPDCKTCKMRAYNDKLYTNVNNLVKNWKGKFELEDEWDYEE